MTYILAHAIPIRQGGLVHDNNNIDTLLQERLTSRKIRMLGGRLRGSRMRTEQVDRDFEMKLRELLSTSGNST